MNPNLEINFWAALRPERLFRSLHESACDALIPMRRGNREVINPATMAFISGHHGTDESLIFDRDEEVVCAVVDFGIDIGFWIVESKDEIAFAPQTDDVLRVILVEAANNHCEVGDLGAEVREEGRIGVGNILGAGIGEDFPVADEVV